MALPLVAGVLLKTARERSALSQRTVAERAGTAQSVVARIEGGQTDPGTGTLYRLLAAAGFEARCDIAPIPIVETHMLADVERILRLSPEERLLEVRNLSRFERAARRV
jgi:predicted transcriptional regulator